MEPEVGDIRGDGHIVVAYCFVDILAMLHQHALWPNALFCPPGGTVQEYTYTLAPAPPWKRETDDGPRWSLRLYSHSYHSNIVTPFLSISCLLCKMG